MTVEKGIYKCAQGHEWEATNCRFSPFESKPCPKCGCASMCQQVIQVIEGDNNVITEG